MLMIDKKNDVQTLRNLGASDKQINQVFLFEGRMISAAGAIIGIAVRTIFMLVATNLRISETRQSSRIVVTPTPLVYTHGTLLPYLPLLLLWGG